MFSAITEDQDGESLEGLSNLLGSYREIRPVDNPPGYVIRLLENQEIEIPDEGLKHITIFREAP